MRSYIVGAVLGVTLLSPNVATRDVVITGRVTDAGTGQAIQGVQVAAVELGRGAVTDSVGRYHFVVQIAARPRQVTVQARRIGYQQAAQVVRVTGDSVRADFALSPSTTQLSTQRITAPSAPLMEWGVAGSSAATIAAPMQGTLLSRPGYDASRREKRAPSGALPAVRDSAFNTESYAHVAENPFLDARANPRSTFSIDVSGA